MRCKSGPLHEVDVLDIAREELVGVILDCLWGSSFEGCAAVRRYVKRDHKVINIQFTGLSASQRCDIWMPGMFEMLT